MISKLSGSGYGVRSLVQISNTNTLKSIYSAYFHSVINYGMFFWGGLVFQQWEDFHLKKESHQNYGWCTTQNFL